MSNQHFSVGHNFPKVIDDIAQEHLLYYYDINTCNEIYKNINNELS